MQYFFDIFRGIMNLIQKWIYLHKPSERYWPNIVSLYSKVNDTVMHLGHYLQWLWCCVQHSHVICISGLQGWQTCRTADFNGLWMCRLSHNGGGMWVNLSSGAGSHLPFMDVTRPVSAHHLLQINFSLQSRTSPFNRVPHSAKSGLPLAAGARVWPKTKWS